MKVVMTGGGSGGHIMPILAVAHELKRQRLRTTVVYVGQRGDQLADVPAADPAIDEVYTVWAGKLRRYADEGWRQWLNVRVQALNVRDVLRVVAGIWQSFWLLRRLKADVVFTRGGFVSVPVALGARLNGIPYITHDSDSIPSLANRLIARWATKHAVALPADLYPYPRDKTISVGVPVSEQYEPVTSNLQSRYRKELGLEAYKQVVLLTGGGNGSGILNDALAANAKYLLRMHPDLCVVHIAGRSLESKANAVYDALGLGGARTRVLVLGFVHDMYRYSAAADLVIARAGATTLTELAIQGKACVIIPAPQLAGNHQVKNTQALAKRGAVVQLSEDQAEQPERLGRTISELLHDDKRRAALGATFATFAHPHAAADLADLITEVAGGKRGHAVAEK